MNDLEVTKLGRELMEWFINKEVESGHTLFATLHDTLQTIQEGGELSVYEKLMLGIAHELGLVEIVA